MVSLEVLSVISVSEVFGGSKSHRGQLHDSKDAQTLPNILNAGAKLFICHDYSNGVLTSVVLRGRLDFGFVVDSDDMMTARDR
jgi:hypothetical protein